MPKLYAFSGLGEVPSCPAGKIFDPSTGACVRPRLPVGSAKSNTLTYALVGGLAIIVAIAVIVD